MLSSKQFLEAFVPYHTYRMSAQGATCPCIAGIHTSQDNNIAEEHRAEDNDAS